MAQQCKTVIFRGNVQGVGFRYTAHRTADGYAIWGYVRNLSNGDVELVLEGDSQQIDRYLADLKGQFEGYIDSQDEKVQPFTGRFSSFTIRH